MTEIILHHYAVSPFAEKIRAILGYKGLAWHSVDIPVVMPKPDVVALSGGYRKTPLLQIGCDVYCDTPLIARTLDQLFPERPVFHPHQDAVGIAAGRWFDRELFFAAVGQFAVPAHRDGTVEMLGGSAATEAFFDDRTRMMSAAALRGPRPQDGRAIAQDTLDRLEAQLASSGAFLLGTQVGWVDFCAYHPLWALGNHRDTRGWLEGSPLVSAWLARIRAYGHGQATALSSEQALASARSAEPRPLPEDPNARCDRVKLGDMVEIYANDYALEPSQGQLVHIGRDELVIERSDERAGRVRVHFPRLGFQVRPLSA